MKKILILTIILITIILIMVMGCTKENDTKDFLQTNSINYVDSILNHSFIRISSTHNDSIVNDQYWQDQYDNNILCQYFYKSLPLWEDDYGYYSFNFLTFNVIRTFESNSKYECVSKYECASRYEYDSIKIINNVIILYSYFEGNLNLKIEKVTKDTLILNYRSRIGNNISITLIKD